MPSWCNCLLLTKVSFSCGYLGKIEQRVLMIFVIGRIGAGQDRLVVLIRSCERIISEKGLFAGYLPYKDRNETLATVFH